MVSDVINTRLVLRLCFVKGVVTGSFFSDSHLQVRADVQSPQVCLQNSQLVFSDLYIGVSTKGSVTLFNQTLLPSHFSWMVGSAPFKVIL